MNITVKKKKQKKLIFHYYNNFMVYFHGLIRGLKMVDGEKLTYNHIQCIEIPINPWVTSLYYFFLNLGHHVFAREHMYFHF